MRHIPAIAGRELGAFFGSPVAYVVLTLWSVLAGTFFLSSLATFNEQIQLAQQYQKLDAFPHLNLNELVVQPFYSAIWGFMALFMPAVTMPLFSAEKMQGTDELLLTSPIGIWEIVVGKFLAAAGFALVMMGIVFFYPGMLLVFGDSDPGTTFAGLLGLVLTALCYVAAGAFASSLTRSQLIAYMLSFMLVVVGLIMLPFLVEISGIGTGNPATELLGRFTRWLASGHHFNALLQGAVSTADVAYFAVMVGIFLVLTKASVESARWR